jgi:hypothetical protein
LDDLSKRLEVDEGRSKALVDNMNRVEVFQKYFLRAKRHAEDENRWPFQIGVQSFDRSRAQKVAERVGRYLDDRRPLVTAYQESDARLKARRDVVGARLESLQLLRERITLSYKRVSLSKKLEDLAGLRRAGAELARAAKPDDATGPSETTPPPSPSSGELEAIDLDNLIK